MDPDKLLPPGPLHPPVGADGMFKVHVNRNPDKDAEADAVHLALREAHVAVWRDLWQKVEDCENRTKAETARLRRENQDLRRKVRNMKKAAEEQ